MPWKENGDWSIETLRVSGCGSLSNRRSPILVLSGRHKARLSIQFLATRPMGHSLPDHGPPDHGAGQFFSRKPTGGVLSSSRFFALLFDNQYPFSQCP